MPRSGATLDAFDGRSRRSLPFARPWPGPVVFVGWALAAVAVIAVVEVALRAVTTLVP